MSKQKNEIMLSYIYDILCGCCLPEEKNDTEWTTLKRRFDFEARKHLKKFIKDKEIIWDGDYNYIQIGRDFIIKLN